MTWITDDSGTRWVEIPQRKRRAPAKPKRFAAIKVGDWLTGGSFSRIPDYRGRKAAPRFYLVTDHWFDPVAGQDDPEKGMLYAIALLVKITDEGEPVFQSKYCHTRRGLASQGYVYSDVADPLAMMRLVREGMNEGSVTPLRKRRPALKGPRPL